MGVVVVAQEEQEQGVPVILVGTGETGLHRVSSGVVAVAGLAGMELTELQQ